VPEGYLQQVVSGRVGLENVRTKSMGCARIRVFHVVLRCEQTPIMNSNRGRERDLPYGTAEQAAEKLASVSGHDFSRAVNN